MTSALDDILFNRLKTVKQVSRKNRYGRIYIPSEFVGKRVVFLTEDELAELLVEFERLKKIKNFAEYILNTKNGSRMFNIISRTWNPVTGCEHFCIYCWARRLALTKLRNTERYKNGFRPRINPSEFTKKFNGGVVFVSDMGDLFGDFIYSEWILKVIDYIKKFPDTYFLFLTKNPWRYHEFIDRFPPNAILGATIETNRDDIYLKYRISKAPVPSDRYQAMKNLDWDMKFISIEPILDFDLDIFADWIREIGPIMVYVGYDNYNWKLPEPPMSKTLELIKRLSEFTLVIKKTIRRSWHESKSLINYLKD